MLTYYPIDEAAARRARVCFKTQMLSVKCKDEKIKHMKRHEISEQQQNRIKDKFPPEKSRKEGGQEKVTGKCLTQSCIG